MDLFEPYPTPSTPSFPGPSLLDRVLLGTSGYSFPDWVGPFYPSGMHSADFLSYYSTHFRVVEINSTYYGIPQPRVIQQMELKTPVGFRFVVKLNQAMTHDSSRAPALYRDFLAAIEPLKVAEKYDGVLAQFPWSFRRNAENEGHLAALRELLPGEPLFAEFRHVSWITPDLEPWLREHEIGYCIVDEPQLQGLVPPVSLISTESAYVRLHGRNAENWWKGERNIRYDYNYSESELKEWIQKIAELADRTRRTYLFFNNCHAGQAARNAKLMQELLRQQPLETPRLPG